MAFLFCNDHQKLIMDKIIRAWVIEGPKPDYHRAQKDRLKVEWPALHQAIEEATLLELSK